MSLPYATMPTPTKTVALYAGEWQPIPLGYDAAEQAYSADLAVMHDPEANKPESPVLLCAQVGAVAVAGRPLTVVDPIRMDTQRSIRLQPDQAHRLEQLAEHGIETDAVGEIAIVQSVAHVMNGGHLTLILCGLVRPALETILKSGTPYGFMTPQGELRMLGIGTDNEAEFLSINNSAGDMSIVNLHSLTTASNLTMVTPLTFINNPALS